jgi:hypothetical protein
VIEKLTLGYQLSNTLQDNRQIGMQAVDVEDRSHNLSIAYAVSDKLNITSAFGQRSSLAKDNLIRRLGDTAQLGVNWIFGDRYTFTSNLSTSDDKDRPLTLQSKNLQANLQLLKQFDLHAFGMKMPGQWSLSYARNNSSSMGLQIRYQSINASLALSFF